MFLQFLFPRLGRFSVLITELAFIFWKLPISDPVIAIYNKVAIIPITRTVDYSDLITLLILPLPDYLSKRISRYKIGSMRPRLLAILVSLPATLAFMATSPSYPLRMAMSGEIFIGKSYRLKISGEDALARIKAAGFPIETDTAVRPWNNHAFYEIKNVVLAGDKDTIEAIHFSIRKEGGKTFLDVRSIRLKNSKGYVPDWKRLGRYYRRLIRSDIVEEVR